VGKRVQRLIDTNGEVYDERPVVGRHKWLIAGREFNTVLVRTVDDKERGQYSLIHVDSGRRLFRVQVKSLVLLGPETATVMNRLLQERTPEQVAAVLLAAPPLLPIEGKEVQP